MKKRFIAGATCPECNAQDTIIAYQDKDGNHCSCVDCGYHEIMKEETEMKEDFIFRQKSD